LSLTSPTASLISRTALAQRLKQLQATGAVHIEAKPKGNGHHYRLTSAGEEFRSVVELMSVWGSARHVTRSQAQSPSGIGIPPDPIPLDSGNAQRLELRCSGKFVEGRPVALRMMANVVVSSGRSGLHPLQTHRHGESMQQLDAFFFKGTQIRQLREEVEDRVVDATY
jgi:HxlR-like helix-turn-helix